MTSGEKSISTCFKDFKVYDMPTSYFVTCSYMAQFSNNCQVVSLRKSKAVDSTTFKVIFKKAGPTDHTLKAIICVYGLCHQDSADSGVSYKCIIHLQNGGSSLTKT